MRNEGSFPGEPGRFEQAADPYGASTPGTDPWANFPGPPPAGHPQATQTYAPPPRRSRPASRLLWVLLAGLVTCVPVLVGVVTYLNPIAPSAGGPSPLAVEATSPPGRIPQGPPTWNRPDWASGLRSATVMELSAGSDVPFASGRLRPTLGMGCRNGDPELHVVTGGTAHIDPESSRHMVTLSFSGSDPRIEAWIGADNQRALFSPDARTTIERIGRSTALTFGYTHYVAGPVEVEFNLRGADTVVASMAESCGWNDD